MHCWGDLRAVVCGCGEDADDDGVMDWEGGGGGGGGARTMWMSDSLPVPMHWPVEWRVLRWKWVCRAR